MKQIFKYELTHPGLTILLPLGAEILDVQYQYHGFMMWAKIDNTEPLVERRFLIFGTGWELPDVEMKYISTVLSENGDLVWHVFETFK